MAQLTVTYKREWIRADDMARTFQVELPGGEILEVEDLAGCGITNSRPKQDLINLLDRIAERGRLSNQPCSGQAVVYRKGAAEVADEELTELKVLHRYA